MRELALTCILLADTVDADSLEHWNDAPERTNQDVLDALNQAAARNQGRQDDDPFTFSPN